MNESEIKKRIKRAQSVQHHLNLHPDTVLPLCRRLQCFLYPRMNPNFDWITLPAPHQYTAQPMRLYGIFPFTFFHTPPVLQAHLFVHRPQSPPRP